MAAMAHRRGRRPSFFSTRRRAAYTCALLVVAALPVAAVMVALAPLPPRSAAVARPSLPRHTPQQDAGRVQPDDEIPQDLAEPLATAAPTPAIALADQGPTGTPQSPAIVNLPILTYHWIRVNPVPSDQLGFHLSVTPDNFAQQMAFLHFAGVHTITLADAYDALQTGKKLPPRSVVLTFDDGYGDFATTAAPIMHRNGLIGTDFVVTGFLGKTAYMTVEQVRQVESMGMVIGCHTVNHLDLSRTPLALAKLQIQVSHQELETLTGKKVLDFAYPYGGYTTAVEQLVLADGFRDAVSTRGGTALQVGNRGAWPRLHIDGADGLGSFASKALWGASPQTVQGLLRDFNARPPEASPKPAPSPSPAAPAPGRPVAGDYSAGAGSRRYS
jgi:peptidoglycan/xylan/chitin deacetylase (PgdA/CDA1 family)